MILERGRPRDLVKSPRDLRGRDINLSAGGAVLAREAEIELLSRVLDEAVLMPELRSAFTERLLVLLQSRGGREGGSGSAM